MTDSNIIARLRHAAAHIYSIQKTRASDLLLEAADALEGLRAWLGVVDDLQACKADAERALGVTAGSAVEAVSLLATEHQNLQQLLAERQVELDERRLIDCDSHAAGCGCKLCGERDRLLLAEDPEVGALQEEAAREAASEAAFRAKMEAKALADMTADGGPAELVSDDGSVRGRG